MCVYSCMHDALHVCVREKLIMRRRISLSASRINASEFVDPSNC